MARMIRKQIVIDAEREAVLERLSKERGVSQSEVIRQAIDEMVAAEEHRAAEAMRSRKAAEWLDAFFRDAHPPGTTVNADGTRNWTREELYEERGSTRR